MSRLRYFIARSLQTVFLLWLIITFLFFFFRLMPGSYLEFMLFEGIQPETIEELERKWGLNEPLYVQYFAYMTNLLTLDAGFSLQTTGPVWEYVNTRIFNTFILVAPGITLGYILGAGIGTFLGTKRGTNIERIGISMTVFLGTLPIFFLGILFILVFSSNLGWFPSSGMLSPGLSVEYQDAAWWERYTTTDFLWHYILPFSVIVIRYINTPALIMRTSVVEVLGQDFVKFQRISGLPKTKRFRHLTKHASLPVITLYPISMTRALSGLVLLEIVFNWPGIGATLVQAVLRRDFAVVQFIFLILAIFILLGNWVVDIVYGYVDPRVTVGSD
jgi:peptide/nickel transport system permease protein